MMLLNKQARRPGRTMPSNFTWAAVVCTALALMASNASADPIVCHPHGEGEDDESAGHAFSCSQTLSHVYTPTTTSNTYRFDVRLGIPSFTDTLSFDTVLVPEMTVFMTAFFIQPGNPEFLARIPAGFEPETFFTNSFGPAWIFFRVENLEGTGAPPLRGIHFGESWTQRLLWFGDGLYDDPQVLHDSRGTPGSMFGAIVTVPGSFDPFPYPCRHEPCDPAIDGSADDFSDVTVVSTVIPEPASLLLVGTGIGGLLYRRRRTSTQDYSPLDQRVDSE